MSKYRKIIALLLAVITLCSFAPLSFAIEANASIPAVMSVRNAPSNIVTFLELNDVAVTDDSIIKFIEVGETIDSVSSLRAFHAETVLGLSITTVYDDVTICDTLFSITQDKDGEAIITSILPSIQDVSVARAGGSSSYTENNITIKGTAAWETFVNGYYQTGYRPNSCYVSYTKSSGFAGTVSKIEMDYITKGWEYTYPNWTMINPSSNEPFAYSMSVSQSNPAASTMYTITKPYSSSRVIDTSTGGFEVGIFLAFRFYISGSTKEYYYTTSIG